VNPKYHSALPPGVPIYPLTVRQYLRMVEVDILGEYDRVELLEGLLVPKKPPTPPHDAKTSNLCAMLGKVLSDQWHVRCKSTLTTKDSVPEPDISVVAANEKEYFRRHPKASETALAIEVSDVTLTIDQIVKRRVYARAKIPAYWLVNLPNFRVEVFTEPKGGKSADYRRCETFKAGDRVLLPIAGAKRKSLLVSEILLLRETDVKS
jgi:Uma2 family endonuclease